MRFKIGDKVEVMNNNEVPVSWRTAEVLSFSGHKYLVQYDSYPVMSSNRIMEMVSRKFVRPCPLMVQGVESFVAGDFVEVFYQFSWKIGIVLNIMGGKREIKRNWIHQKAATFRKQYSVRLIGCSKDLVIDGSSIRMRQTWHGDKWIVMGKNPRSGDEIIASKPSTSNCTRKMNSHVPQFSGRASNQPIKKRAIIQEDASFNIISNGHNTERDDEQHGFGSCELNNSDSDACSVGSCSVTNQSLRTLYTDAESFYGERKGFYLPSKGELEVSVRSLELHAYRSTLEALYASGPLSWEQEAMLTNLRITLHISNDEHLKELKQLISAKNGLRLEACIICFRWSKDDARVCSPSLGIELWTISVVYFHKDATVVAAPWYQTI